MNAKLFRAIVEHYLARCEETGMEPMPTDFPLYAEIRRTQIEEVGQYIEAHPGASLEEIEAAFVTEPKE